MDSLHKTRTFVLGAGFSAGAGIPTTDKLLHEAFKLMSYECDGIYQRIESYAKVCFDNKLPLLKQDLGAFNFSKLCSYLHHIEMTEYGGGERWCDNGSREVLTLKYFISKAIAKLTPDTIPEQYLEFAKQLDCCDVVLTFNYDCLLEKSLEMVGKEYTYDWHEIDWTNHPNRIFIVKMHGSINWSFPMGGEIDDKIYKRSFEPAMNLEAFYHSRILTDRGIWDQNNTWLCPIYNKNFIQPFIILPGTGKSFDVRKLAFFWYKSSGYFYSSRDAVIIGLSLSEDDFFVRFLLLESLPLEDWSEIKRRTIIINNSEDDLSNYGFIPDNKKIVRNKKFDLDDVKFFSELKKNLN
jgi:hypothetical protein